MAWSHWRSSSAIDPSGHGYQTKFTAVPPAPSPGFPDIVTSLVTPSSAASRMVERMIATCRSPTAGWSGHAEQLSAAIRSPREANASRKALRRPASPRSSSRRRCGARDCPPVAISIAVAPTRAATSSAPSKECSGSESV